MEKGLILITTGPGKGKTTAAIGVAVRALGQGFNVAFLQFIKIRNTGESFFLETYAQAHPPRLENAKNDEGQKEGGGLFYKRMGLGFVFDSPGEDDLAKAALALEEARSIIGGNFSLVVLDEICVAMDKGLIRPSDVVSLIESKAPSVNMILTGRGCPEEIIALADTVTEMRPIKHAYENGVKARRGIEF